MFYSCDSPDLTTKQIAQKALGATVLLEMEDENGQPLGFGSGFFIGQNQIATNFHVIAGAARGTAKLVGELTTYTIEGIIATDESNDLAILKVSATGIQHLPLDNSNDVQIGETVYVSGNPKGLEGTFSDGIISSRRGNVAKKRLQMTAPVSPGSSGGPVLNAKGKVIGVSFMTIEGGQNLNFAIPSNYLKVLVARADQSTPFSDERLSISAETYFSWGNKKMALGQYSEAIEDYNKAIQLKPDYVNAYGTRGNAKSDLGQHKAAIIDYEMIIRLDPDNALAYYSRGGEKRYLGQYEDAILDYDMAIHLKPDYVLAYNNRGLLKSELGQHEAAIVDLEIALQLEPNGPNIYNNRGIVKDRMGQYLEAIADYNKAIELKMDHYEAYINRGFAKIRLGQYEAAIVDYDKAIELKPDSFETYYRRGIMKHEMGQYLEAIADYDKTIELKPDSPDVYDSRGLAKAYLNLNSAAIIDFDKAIELKPDFALAFAHRGLVKVDLDRVSEAKKDLQIALKFAEQTGNKDLKVSIEQALSRTSISRYSLVIPET